MPIATSTPKPNPRHIAATHAIWSRLTVVCRTAQNVADRNAATRERCGEGEGLAKKTNEMEINENEISMQSSTRCNIVYR